ncbi:hypothetical protein F2P45_27225 [Massilia sp. CCM 8733]|uniref:Uncharacterized protein n=1 Tax=Massilia mucilaginosa TaxID=2609282 RepID=A0ABX0P0N5_9BURK|nr:hypothetical protein [Massilia mucilaginosa]NHZ92672.1 hypothetical protein [Massilia mucilaginosa]
MSDESHSQDGMEKRVANLEANVASMMLDVSVMKTDVAVLRTDVAVMKLDVEVVKSTCATKGDVSEMKSSIIMWLTAVVFVSQLIPDVISASRSLF